MRTTKCLGKTRLSHLNVWDAFYKRQAEYLQEKSPFHGLETFAFYIKNFPLCIQKFDTQKYENNFSSLINFSCHTFRIAIESIHNAIGK